MNPELELSINIECLVDEDLYLDNHETLDKDIINALNIALRDVFFKIGRNTRFLEIQFTHIDTGTLVTRSKK